MAIWFQLALVLNVICWAIFLYSVSLRRWTWGALIAGILHMSYGGLASVAPFRSLLDPNYAGLGLGFLRFEGQAAVLPATLLLGWAMAAAWVAVGKGRGSWMGLIVVGDTVLALNIGGSILLGGASHWTFQLGESISISGLAGLLVLLGFLTVPLLASAVWAFTRTSSGGSAPPLGQRTRDTQDVSEEDAERRNGFNYGFPAIRKEKGSTG